MNIVHRSVHALALLALLSAAWGSARPAAQAAGGPPPELPAGGSVPATPPGCTTSHYLSGLKTVSLPIPDATDANHPGVVTTTVQVNSQGAHIWDVNVVTAISHTWSSDLVILLVSPSGKTVTLSSNNGFVGLLGLTNIFNGTTWDDQAGLTSPPGPVTMATFTDGVPKTPLMPEEPLAAFNGDSPNGTWSLVVKDTSANGQIGTLRNWSLEITALNETPATLSQAATDGDGVAIPDAGSAVTQSVDLGTLPAPVSAITLTTIIDHNSPGDLVIELISPSGITLTVSNRNGGSHPGVFGDTFWYDAAGVANPPGAMTDHTFVDNTNASPLAPQEGFAEMNGLNGSGVWTLRVRDVKANAIGGSLASMHLVVGSDTCLPQLSLEGSTYPDYPRLGQAAHVSGGATNDGLTAHNVVLTTTVGGPFAFQSAANPGWACVTPAPGTLSPTVHCSRATADQGLSYGTLTTLTAPLTPMAAPFTVTISSDKLPASGLIASDHGYLAAYAHSANGNPWALADNLNEPNANFPDSGELETGGQQSLPGFGSLQVRVSTLGNGFIAESVIDDLGLTYGAGGHWHTMAPQLVDVVDVARDIGARPGTDWVRYVDSFTNNSGLGRRLMVDWGGDLGHQLGLTTTATSSGDPILAANDTYGVIAFREHAADPSSEPPEGLVFRSPADTSYLGPYVFLSFAFTNTAWSPPNYRLGQVFQFDLAPGATRRLAYFVYRGLAEGQSGPEDCTYYGGCVTPAAGTQVALVEGQTRGLAAAPPFCDLSAGVRASLVNWPGLVEHCTYLPGLYR